MTVRRKIRSKTKTTRARNRVPTVNSGDASIYFGLPEGTITWADVDQQLREKHGSSLSELCEEMGLKGGSR